MGRIQLSQKSIWLLSTILSGLSLGIIGGLILLAAPHSQQKSAGNPDEIPDLVKIKNPELKPIWGYTGPNGPEFWPNLEESFGACALKSGQSPVDLSGNATRSEDLELKIVKSEFTMALRNAGPFFEGRILNQAEVSYKDHSYFLTHLEIHTPSEHSFNQQHLSEEIQFYFASDRQDELAIALPVKEGEENSAFAAFTLNLPENFSEETPQQEFNLAQLLDLKSQSFYKYVGSATSPPCRPRIPWIILAEPSEFSHGQVEALFKLMGKNNRPVQWTHEAP